jgi:hypothetical protein
LFDVFVKVRWHCDLSGEEERWQLFQSELSVASSADGTRGAVVSSSSNDALVGEVTVYQRIGDKFMEVWKSVGTNFVSETTSVEMTTCEMATKIDTNTT